MNNTSLILKAATLTLGVITAIIITGCSGGGGDDEIEPITPLPRTAEKLIFIADSNGTSNQEREIYTVLDNGNDFSTLASHSGNISLNSMAISSDNKTAAYIVNLPRLGVNDISLYSVPLSGGASTLIDDNVTSFAWSPDGQSLTYSSTKDSSFFYSDSDQVYIASLQGGQPQRINGAVGSPPRVDVISPVWSSDGRYIIQEVAPYRDDGTSIAFGLNVHEVGGAENNSTRILEVEYINQKAMSASGEYLALDIQDSNGDALAILSMSGELKILSRTTFRPDFLWSPNKDQLVYVDGTNDSLIKLYDVETSSERVIVNTNKLSGFSNSVRGISWSPDGKMVGFVAVFDTDSCNCLYQVNPEQGINSIQKLSTGASYIRSFEWSLDSQKVAYVDADTTNNDVQNLYSVRTSNGDITRLSNNFLGDEKVEQLAWSRLSTGLVFEVQKSASATASSVPKGLYYVNLTDSEPEYINIGDLSLISDLQYIGN